jgi:anti-anti-sigma factor
MTARSRHGLHAVRDGEASTAEQPTPVLPNAPGQLFLSLDQQSVVLAVAGRLNADTAGRLRMHLSMFTVDGGPRELVLDLSDILAVDEDGMAPLFEADEAMRMRKGSLRLVSVSAAVTHFLQDARCDRTLVTGRPPDPASGPGLPAPDDDRPRRGRD